jgi:hypothetical protein
MYWLLEIPALAVMWAKTCRPMNRPFRTGATVSSDGERLFDGDGLPGLGSSPEQLRVAGRLAVHQHGNSMTCPHSLIRAFGL